MPFGYGSALRFAFERVPESFPQSGRGMNDTDRDADEQFH